MEKVSEKPPLFTNRALVALIIPLILDSLLSIIAGMVDSAMVSSAGEAAVSAVSLVDSINVLFIALMSGLSVGGSVITSQYIGSRNLEKARCSANQILYASTTVATVSMLVMLCLVPQTLRLIYGSIEADVFENAKIYFYITLLSYPFFAVANVTVSLMRSMARSRNATIVAIGANLLNVAGNAILIYGFDMGIAGAAIATTLSRVFWAVAGVAMMRSKTLPVRFEGTLKFHVDWDIMRRMLHVGVSNSVESGLFQAGKIMTSSLVSTFGTVFIAANSVSSTLCNLGWGIINSFSMALLTVVGQCIGADQPDQARKYTKKMLCAVAVAVVTLFGSIFLLRHQLVRLFDFTPETLEVCAYYTGVGALLTILACYPFSFVPVHAFRAAGDIRYAVTLSVSSMFIFRVGLSYLLAHVFGLGLLSIWIGCWADWFFRAILNFFRFRTNKWLHKKLI